MQARGVPGAGATAVLLSLRLAHEETPGPLPVSRSTMGIWTCATMGVLAPLLIGRYLRPVRRAELAGESLEQD